GGPHAKALHVPHSPHGGHRSSATRRLTEVLGASPAGGIVHCHPESPAQHMLICRYFVTCPQPALSKTNDPSKLSAAWSSTEAAVTAPDYPPFMLFVTAIVLAIFVLPSPWKWIVMAVAAVLDLGEYVLYYWWSHRGRVKAGA